MHTTASTASESLAAFLKAELDSPTEGHRLRAVLDRLDVPEQVLASPNVDHPAEDECRWAILDSYRGGKSLFDTLDIRNLDWMRARLSERDPGNRTVTCRHRFENEYGTRDPSQIALELNARGHSNDAAKRLREGENLEPPLLVGNSSLDRLAILEGHNRIISYLRDLSAVALPLPVFIGIGRQVSHWR